MESMLVALKVLKLDKLMYTNEWQSENKSLIIITFEVSKFPKSNEINEEQKLNILFM